MTTATVKQVLAEYKIDYDRLTVNSTSAKLYVELTDPDQIDLASAGIFSFLKSQALKILDSLGGEVDYYVTWIEDVAYATYSVIYSLKHVISRLKDAAIAKVAVAKRNGRKFIANLKAIVPHPEIDLSLLTNRQKEVYSLMSLGLRSSEIANRLNLKVKAISDYRFHIKHRLGVEYLEKNKITVEQLAIEKPLPTYLT